MSEDRPAPPPEDEPAEATLTFREQADGRKVARLPGGKVVLVAFSEVDRVNSGERWRVRLRHRDTFSIADPIERERPELTNPVLPPDVQRLIVPRPPAPPATTPVVTPAPLPAAQVVPAPPAAPPQVSPPLAAPPRSADTVADRQRVAPQGTPISPSRVVGMQDRVAMFVDGANMDLACRLAGYFVDYRRARQFFLAAGHFNAAYYYIADYTASDPLQQRYLDFLAHAGYIVRRKAVKVIRDHETGERVLKANVDTELVLDLINTADNYDLAFLFSGDSDFERAVDLLRSRGKRVYVVTSRQVISRELAYVSDKPIFFLEDFRPALEREDRQPGAAGDAPKA